MNGERVQVYSGRSNNVDVGRRAAAMLRRILGTGAVLALCLCGPESSLPSAAQDAKQEPPAAGNPAQAGAAVTPLELVKSATKGALKNPFTDNPGAIAEGTKLFRSFCSGCHGGNGGGGMGPPVSNVVWVYGSDDDTLFRLITLGTDDFQAQGYARKARENVVGPMPPFGELINTDQDLWKIIAFIRANYRGDPSRRNW